MADWLSVYNLAQLQIVCFGLVAIGLLASRHPLWRWGFVLGLANQWAWFYVAWHDGAWGILLINIGYLVNYVRGIRNYFGVAVWTPVQYAASTDRSPAPLSSSCSCGCNGASRPSTPSPSR